MLSKWFKKKSVPDNDGSSDPSTPDAIQYGKLFELVLSNMEDSPVYELTNQLSVGSEIGNIIISDPSISPKHATFTLQDEVISLIDHGSLSGTYVNGKKITPGKHVILEETDIINIGDLQVRLRVRTFGVKTDAIPDIPTKKTIEPIKSVEGIKDRLKSFESKNDELKKKTQKNQKKSIVISAPNYSTNAIVRVAAVTCDLLLSYVLLVVFLPFDEFKELVEFIPTTLGAFLDVEWKDLWIVINEDFGFISEMMRDMYSLLPSSLDLTPLLIVFGLTRFATTSLLGVSFSEYCLGVRSSGNFIWARVGGMFRVIFGFLTWPFIVFDISSVVSRRTLKEFITFTNAHVPSSFISVLGFILYVPLVISLVVVAPFFQGLEAPEVIYVDDKIDQRVRLKLPQDANSENASITEMSKKLNFNITYNPSELRLIPNFKFRGLKEKTKLTTSLIFYQKDLKKSVEFEVYKTFDLKQLLGVGIRGNFFLYDKYRQIYDYVYESEGTNSSFRKNKTEKIQLQFANEMIEFTKNAFSLRPETAFEVMQEQTPLIKSFIDFKSSFLELLEYKQIDQVSFIKIGNAIFMKISFIKQKPFDLIIPMLMGEGRIFKITYENRESFRDASPQLYKFNLDNTNWIPEASGELEEAMSALQVFDLFSRSNFYSTLQLPSKAQALYAFAFEKTGSVLKSGDPIETALWKAQIQGLLRLVETLPDVSSPEGEENTKQKLLQNVQDILDAMENSNLEFFGIAENTTL